MRIFYLNGDFTPEDQAMVSVLDRGFVMADSVYEVLPVFGGKIANFDYHFARLSRSTSELGIKNPFDAEALFANFKELVKRNALNDGRIYLQITRGVMDRDFLYPEDMTPTVVMFTQEAAFTGDIKTAKIITKPDLRWQRGDIKTTQLLYASMMKTEARRSGADDCWFERDGMITEGSSNNAYIVKNNEIITRPVSNLILPGITRASILRLCEEHNVKLTERPFTVEEALEADEAFLTSASAFVMAVVDINGSIIGNGAPGSLSARLYEIYTKEIISRAR